MTGEADEDGTNSSGGGQHGGSEKESAGGRRRGPFGKQARGASALPSRPIPFVAAMYGAFSQGNSLGRYDGPGACRGTRKPQACARNKRRSPSLSFTVCQLGSPLRPWHVCMPEDDEYEWFKNILHVPKR
jgi:hypothetical protein